MKLETEGKNYTYHLCRVGICCSKQLDSAHDITQHVELVCVNIECLLSSARFWLHTQLRLLATEGKIIAMGAVVVLTILGLRVSISPALLSGIWFPRRPSQGNGFALLDSCAFMAFAGEFLCLDLLTYV